MAAYSVFRWLDGSGWLVLAGSGLEEVRAHALSRAAADGAVAVIADNAGQADAILADLEDLGAPAGYIVDAVSEPDDELRAQIGEAGIVVIHADADPDEVRSLLAGAAIEAMEAAFQNGAVVLCEGSAAQILGAWILSDGTVPDGFGWLIGAVIELGPPPAGGEALAVLETNPDGLAVALAKDAALAFGPEGQVELWGSRRVAVTLGAAWGDA